jgi:hypothetical protein
MISPQKLPKPRVSLRQTSLDALCMCWKPREFVVDKMWRHQSRPGWQISFWLASADRTAGESVVRDWLFLSCNLTLHWWGSGWYLSGRMFESPGLNWQDLSLTAAPSDLASGSARFVGSPGKFVSAKFVLQIVFLRHFSWKDLWGVVSSEFSPNETPQSGRLGRVGRGTEGAAIEKLAGMNLAACSSVVESQ